jgi:signal transduction histidine kinase
MLDDLGLVAALEWQARELARTAGLEIEVQAEESAGDVSEVLRTCIYRISQEALRNCARHAQATRAVVALERTPRNIKLRIVDNGKGFHVERTRGLGLLGMEERVAQLGGSFRIESQLGRGTTLIAELPA